MPKFFFKKKKKKAKPSIRDALTPSSAFVAVPSTPPPTSGKSSFPIKKLDISAPIPAPSNPFSNDIAFAANASRFDENAASYSLVGHAEEEGEESEVEPGYATVAETSGRRVDPVKDRPRLATPLHGNGQQEGALGASKAGMTLPTLPQVDDRGYDGQNLTSPIQEFRGHSVQSDVANDRVASLAPPLRSEHGVNREFINSGEYGDEDESGYNQQEQLQLSEHLKETMYSKVMKQKAQQEGPTTVKVVVGGSDLPPKSPHSLSPPRGKDKGRTPLESSPHNRQKLSPRDSSSPRQQHINRPTSRDQPHHHSRVLNDSDGRPLTDGAVDEFRSKKSSNAATRHNHSQPTRNQQRRRNMSDSYLHPKHQKRWYDDDIDNPLEYTDESYLPSGEDETDTITESYFNHRGDIPGDYPDGSRRVGNYVQRRQHHQHRSRSSSLPGQQLRYSPMARKKVPHPGYDHLPLKRQKRPATCEGIPLEHTTANIPFFRPPSLQPVYPVPPDQVYVFSEVQPDGTIQYYSATPVNSPSALSPPTHAPPSYPVTNHVTHPGIPRQAVSLQSMPTHAYHQAQDNNGHGNGATDGRLSSSSDHVAKFSRRVPVGESGYFSGPLTKSQQDAIQHNQPQPSVNAVANSTSRLSVSPTNLRLPSREMPQLQTHFVSSPNGQAERHSSHSPLLAQHQHQYYQRHSHQNQQHKATTVSGRRSKSPAAVSPAARLLENSLQRANETPASDLITDTTRLAHGGRSPRFSYGSGTAAVPPVDSAVGMAALQEQKEKMLKARIKALEDTAEELCTENANLKQLCDELKQEASGSVEQLQRKLSSIMSENQSYREVNRNKDKQLERDKNEITRLKSELEKVKEENKHLLRAKQSADLDRQEWEKVSEHAQSVLDENTSLLKQQELLKEQMKEMKGQHQAIVSQLNTEVSRVKKDRETVEKKLASLHESHGQLQSQFDQLVERSSQQVSISDHQSALKEMHGLLEELEERTDSETKSQDAQLRILTKEKTSLVAKLTDAKAIIIQLEQECTRMHKNLRVAQEKISEQRIDLESARDREVASHERLAKTVSVAEKAIAERETFAKIAKAQQKANERAGVQSALQGATVGRIEREFEIYKQETDAKLEQANTQLRDKEREYRVQRKKLEREINHLKHQLKTKQYRLGEITKEKQLSDDRVELMWRAKIEASKADARAKYYSSMNPVAAAAAASSSDRSTAGHLLGHLSKLSTHVHPS